MNFKKHQKELILGAVITFFAVIYSLISLVNHYLFRTFALDLGMFNQAMYCFSHCKMNYFTLDVKGNEACYFGDHFSPITILLSPLYYLAGSYTLLIVQIVAIILGGIGIYKFTALSHAATYLPLILVVQFFCLWGIYFALSADYHNNVLAAMMVPWLLYYYEKSNKKALLMIFFLILITKENMALWLCFIILGLAIRTLVKEHNRKSVLSMLKFELPLVLGSFLYFVVIVGLVMPYLNPSNDSSQLHRYAHLGGSVPGIAKTILTNPRYVFSLLFESPLNTPAVFGAKSELHFAVLFSGGYALFFCPYYLVMLIPIYVQKLLVNDSILWGVGGTYSIEFVPVLVLCLSDFLSRFKLKRTAYLVAIITVISTIACTYSLMESCRIPWYDKMNVAFYDRSHYQTNLNIKEINEALKSIPDKVPVSASSLVAPHLACRQKLYHFPVIKDAKFIVLLMGNHYPLKKEEFLAKISECVEKDNFRIKYNANDLLILEKKQ